MPETCGCCIKGHEWRGTDGIAFCPLHARAAEMRECLVEAREASGNCACGACKHIDALLEATHA